MSAALILTAGLGALLLLVVALATRRGRTMAELRMAEEALDVRDRQLEAANRRARDDAELAGRLRAGRF
jgi:hypothetical protein